MATTKDLDEAFWGNEELTVEEFDFLQSQLVDNTTRAEHCAQSEGDSWKHLKEIRELKEQQDIQDGHIKMLRAALAQRSKELDQERLEREQILVDRLQQHRDKEIQLQRSIERLQSELKFKDQEVRCTNNKVHTLEQKLKQQPSVSSKTKSPDKLVTNTTFSFHEKPTLLNKNTQTDDGKRISFHRTAALIEMTTIPDASHATVAITKASDIRLCSTSRALDQRIFPQNGRLLDKPFYRRTWETISMANKAMNLANTLHLNCYCTVESVNKYRYPEFGMLQQIQESITDYISVVSKLYGVKDTNLLCLKSGHCNKCLKVIYSQQSSCESVPKEVFYNAQMLAVNVMKELADLIAVSKVAGKIILEKWRESTSTERGLFIGKKMANENEQEVSLLMLLLNTSVPLFSSGKLINKSVIEWVLIVLHSLTTYTCRFCMKYFDRILHNLCLNVLLDGTCGDEIAFLALKFLCCSLPCAFIEPFLGHHSDPCILGSIAKFYNRLSLAVELTENQYRCYVPLIIDFLTGLIINHGSNVVVGGSVSCVCFSELLEAIIICLLLVCRKLANVLVLRKGLHFLHLISKSFSTFRELRHRVDDEYVMLICDASVLGKTELKDMLEVIRDLWDFRQDESKEFDKDETKPMDIVEVE